MDKSFELRARAGTGGSGSGAGVESQRRRTKLRVGAASDPAETQADRIADAVIADLARQETAGGGRPWPTQTRIRRSSAVGTVERDADPPAEVVGDLVSAVTLDPAPAIPRSVAPAAVGREGGPVDAETETLIERGRAGGFRLPDPLRRSMETSFGADFGRVRLHTGPSSDELNRSMQARAFTIGGDVFFARNQYQPDSTGGRALLAHELAHTVQQGAADRSASVQRVLVDVAGVTDKFQTTGLVGVSRPAWTEVFNALGDYKKFMSTKLVAGDAAPKAGGHRAGQTIATGAALYNRAQTLLDALSLAIGKIIRHKKAKKLDTEWANVLVEQEIPQTLGWAGTVRDNFADFDGMTVLEALQDSRSSALTAYLKGSFSPDDWDDTSEAARQLMRQNRDSDAAVVAAIQRTAKQMMARKESPKAILGYMAAAAKNFVQRVITDYITTMGLDEESLVVVSTGSFGGGELFPYSDIDIQLMKAGMGNDPAEFKRMDTMLHNIRMRIRLATMKEHGGQWKATKAWDVDQLTQDAFTAADAATGDLFKGLVYTNVIVATGGGAAEARELQQRQQSNMVASATTIMDDMLWAPVNQGTWRMKKPEALDEGAPIFEFKEKFLRLPRLYLNVLAMFHNLASENSWSRIDELVRRQLLTKKVGTQFKEYLDITAKVRLRYQFFYEEEGLDTVSPTKTKKPANAIVYPNGYYHLTADDRKLLKKAQIIQDVWFAEIKKTRDQLHAYQPADNAATSSEAISEAV
jgi:hypothetical protein